MNFEKYLNFVNYLTFANFVNFSNFVNYPNFLNFGESSERSELYEFCVNCGYQKLPIAGSVEIKSGMT